MIGWPNLPYELIGRATVAIVSLIVFLLGSGILIFVGWFVWVRGWAWISERMWKGYDPNGDVPPLWKMRISAVTIALSRFEFRKLPVVYREAEDLADDQTTIIQAVKQRLSRQSDNP